MNFQFQIREYKKQNGTQAIRLRFFTSSKDIQYIDTGISVLKTQWDSKKQVVKKHPLEEKLNASLISLNNELKALYYKNEGISAKRLLQIYKNSKKYGGSSLIEFYQSIVDEAKLKESIRTAKTLQHYVNKLKMFSSHISFSDINPIWAKEYELWLVKRGNNPNTIASNFKGLNAVINKAVRLGLIDKNTLKGYEIKTINSHKVFLSIEEIKLLEDCNIPERFKSMNLSRDVFLFSFYTAGMRFSDICKLKWENITENEIIYTMNKSVKRAGAKRFIPMNPKIIKILEKYKGGKEYVFPMIDDSKKLSIEDIERHIHITNNKLNRSLKALAGHLGINKRLNLHVGKHSFANYAVKNNVDLLLISRLLGHTKLATTEYYLRDFYQKEQSDVMNKLFGDE